jgi:multidrug efflux pump
VNLTRSSINNPVGAWMIMAITVLLGAIGLSRIGVSSMPDVDFPVVNIVLPWPGAAAEVVEKDLVQPVEEALAGVEGVKSVTSKARLGSATITLELHLGRDVEDAIQQVQTQINLVRGTLPKDVEPATINKINFEDFPILWVSLSGPFSRAVLADHVRYVLKERLQQVPGVADIQWGGYLDRNVRIWLDRAKLDERDLTAVEIVRRLQTEHIELPAGLIEGRDKEMDVRVLGEAMDLATLRSLTVGGTADQPVRLADVALVEDGFADERARGRNDGDPAQAVGIKKQRGANTVEVAAAVKLALDDIRKDLPPGMRLEINYDDSVYIARSVADVEHELLLAVLLTSLVVWAFLGSWRAMLNVLLAVPMSLMGTIAAIWLLGYTLNTFTLLALALVVGLVVDDAIMVQENISRYTELGMKVRRAALRGTLEIAFAAAAATLAVISVFFPLGLVPGILGKYLIQFGVTLSIAVAFSYLEAITLAPARCAQFLTEGRHERGVLGRAADATFATLQGWYARILPVSVARPWTVFAITVAAFIGGILLFIPLRKELFPKEDRGAMFVRVETQAGSSLDETDRAFRQVEAWMAAQPEIKRYFCVIGGFGGTGVNSGVVFVTLTEKAQRTATQADIEARARADFAKWPGITATIQDLGNPGSRGEIEFSLRGSDWQALADASASTMERMRASGLFVDVDTDYQLGRPQLSVLPDRDRARDLGVSANDIATSLSILVGGSKVGKFSQGGRRIDMRARLLHGDRLRPEDLAAVKVRAGDGTLVPLSEVVAWREEPVLDGITRKDRSRAISVTANIATGRSQGEAQAWIDEQLRPSLATGVNLVKQGTAAVFMEMIIGLGLAFIGGLVVAWMILAGQFNSTSQALTVLTVLPLAIVGAAIGLLIGGHSINFLSGLGILLLMGIVKKNSILLVDFANRARIDSSLDAAGGMVQAGAVRLRPILMTSAATMAAAVPTAIGIGAGAELRQPMAVAVFWGVLVSTLLSLVVVPAVYVLTERHAAVRWLLLFLAAMISLPPLAGLMTQSFQVLGIAAAATAVLFGVWGLVLLVRWMRSEAE